MNNSFAIKQVSSDGRVWMWLCCSVIYYYTVIVHHHNRANEQTKPTTSHSQKNKVKDQLAAIALKEGTVALPDNYTLLDISFLDTIKPSEASDLKAEEAFWAAQKAAGESGQPGSLIHW